MTIRSDLRSHRTWEPLGRFASFSSRVVVRVRCVIWVAERHDSEQKDDALLVDRRVL